MRTSTRSLTAIAAIALVALTACGSDASTSSPAPTSSALLGTTGPIGAADDAALKSALRTVANEMEAAYTEYQAYPADISQTGNLVRLGTVQVALDDGMTMTGMLIAPGTPSAGYCLTATSPGAPPMSYNSTAGGLTAAPCPA